MNRNRRSVNDSYTDKIFQYSNLVVKTALFVVILTMSIAVILLLFYGSPVGRVVSWQAVFIWYSISGSMWILASAPVYLLSLAIYSRYSGKSAPIKKLFILLLVAVFAATAFIATAVLLKVWE